MDSTGTTEPIENDETLYRAESIVEQALREGMHFYGFLSGGGLRVLSLGKKPKGQDAYGEGPTFEYALLLLAEDHEKGGRSYNEVYGTERPLYVTGQSLPTSRIDTHLRTGAKVAACGNKDGITVTLRGLEEVRVPKAIEERVRTTRHPEDWTDRGYTYRSESVRFANGTIGVSTSVVSSPPGERQCVDPWRYHYERTATATTFREAVAAAFEAPIVEVSRSY